MSRRYLVVIVVGIVSSLIGFISGSSALANQFGSEKPVLRRSFDKWGYEATQVGNQIYLRVSSRISDPAALKTMFSEHRNQQAKLFRSMQIAAPVAILLKQPLSPDELADFATRHGISVQSYVFIAQDMKGDVVTLFGAPVDGELLPIHILDAMVKNIEERQNTKLTVEGIVSIDAQLDSTAFTQVSSDAKVLGVDMSPALALQDLQKQVEGVDISTVKLTSAPFYWIAVQKR